VDRPYLLVVSEPDPVAPRVAAEWGTLPSTGDHVDGTAIRRLAPDTLVLRRAGIHVNDERLDLRLPPSLREQNPTIVFPSIHRSSENIACLTTHSLGNLGPGAGVGGRARTVCPSDPRSMTQVLRRLADEGKPTGLMTTFESTHHGPELELPAFFVEIGYGTLPEPPQAAVKLLASVLREIRPDAQDRVAFAVGGGHYAPHFTDLALRRRWSFGHIVSRHALQLLDAETARSAYAATRDAEGIVYARAQDATNPALVGLGLRLRDVDAPMRKDETPRI
jgi:D-tyrosyl-tRNA(Tyr) deacylase